MPSNQKPQVALQERLQDHPSNFGTQASGIEPVRYLGEVFSSLPPPKEEEEGVDGAAGGPAGFGESRQQPTS